MATTHLKFIVPRTELPRLYDQLEADNVPCHELRVRHFTASKVVRDIVTDGKPIGVREVEIITDIEHRAYFRQIVNDAVGGGRK